MKALLVDVGNSRLRAKVWPAQIPEQSEALETLIEFHTSEILPDSEIVRMKLLDILEKLGTPPVVLVSVVPAITALFEKWITNLIVVDYRCPLEFESEVVDLSLVGPDRLCNVAAAIAAGYENALIVDAGTATTFDVLAEGVFLGGLIAPGMAFSANLLGELAARLHPVPFEPCSLKPGTDTESAMAAGAWHVGVGGIETVISGLLEDRPRTKVILTGGLGHHLHQTGRLVDPDWTLRGAAELAGLKSLQDDS